MDITFLVGNGFDLNLGLKTSYSDFIEEYIKAFDDDSDLIKHFKEMIRIDLPTWADAEVAFGNYTEWFANNMLTAEDFYVCYDDFCIKLAAYLDKQEKMVEFISSANVTASAFVEAIAFDAILDRFPDNESERLIKVMNSIPGGYDYRFISFNYTKTLDRFISSVINVGDAGGKRSLTGRHYYNTIAQAVHVHGTTYRSMVLGVNDKSQLSAPGLFDGYNAEYAGQMIKEDAIRLSGDNSALTACNLLQTSDMIYIFGMSLGLTDKVWWQRVLKVMIEKKHVHLIIFANNAPEYSGLIVRRRTKWNRENQLAKQAFIDRSGVELSDDEKADLLSRIHYENTNLFEPLREHVEILKTKE